MSSLRRSKPLQRKTGLKRSTKPIARISPRRRKERAVYKDVRLEYLEAHPFCQISIAIHRQTEERILANDGFYTIGQVMRRIPYANQIHHRNKARGARLTDSRWFMSACPDEHEHVEGDKDWARQEGFLLPLEADPDGYLPDGSRALETPEFIAKRALQRGPG